MVVAEKKNVWSYWRGWPASIESDHYERDHCIGTLTFTGAYVHVRLCLFIVLHEFAFPLQFPATSTEITHVFYTNVIHFIAYVLLGWLTVYGLLKLEVWSE